MLVARLKKKEEFQEVCQGKTVFYTLNGGLIYYFTLATANDVEVLYAFGSETPIPFRENYDFEDAEAIHVWQLLEINGLHCLDVFDGIMHSEVYDRERSQGKHKGQKL